MAELAMGNPTDVPGKKPGKKGGGELSEKDKKQMQMGFLSDMVAGMGSGQPAPLDLQTNFGISQPDESAGNAMVMEALRADMEKQAMEEAELDALAEEMDKKTLLRLLKNV